MGGAGLRGGGGGVQVVVADNLPIFVLSSFSTVYNSPDPGLVLIADLVLVVNSVFHNKN